MAEPTYYFDPIGREQYVQTMKENGYVELPGYEASDHCYCCLNCPAMVQDPQSPTGYWCGKLKFPDRPNGCCDGWYSKTQTKDIGSDEYGDDQPRDSDGKFASSGGDQSDGKDSLPPEGQLLTDAKGRLQGGWRMGDDGQIHVAVIDSSGYSGPYFDRFPNTDDGKKAANAFLRSFF